MSSARGRGSVKIGPGAGTSLDADSAAAVDGTFLAQLREEERAPLFELGLRCKFPKDALLMFQDEQDERLHLLLTGRVKITRAAPGGRELLLAIRDAGDLIGELAFIDGLPRVASVSALEDMEALLLSPGRFRQYLEQTPRAAVVLIELMAGRMRESTLRRLQFAASDTLGRLGSRIIELVDRYGEQTAEGFVVQMPISQDELAGWTGASRAGVAQGLQTMRELGWLRTERRTFVVCDIDALRSRSA